MRPSIHPLKHTDRRGGKKEKRIRARPEDEHTGMYVCINVCINVCMYVYIDVCMYSTFVCTYI